MKESQFLIHGNGKDKPATGFTFEKQHMKSLYFNQSPNKVKEQPNFCLVLFASVFFSDLVRFWILINQNLEL